MLLVYLVLLTMISIGYLAIKRDRESLLTFFACATLAGFLFFALMYIAKKGGYNPRMVPVFFLTDVFRQKLQYIVILLRNLGFGLAVGRHLFPPALLLLAVYGSDVVPYRKFRWFSWAAVILPAVTIALYYYPVNQWFYGLWNGAKSFLVEFSAAWSALYVAAAIVICVTSGIRISIRRLRRQYLAKVAMLLAMAAVYLMYFRQDPAQVYMFYHDDYMAALGLWYLNPMMGYATHMVVLSATVVCTFISVMYLVQSALISMAEKRQLRSRRQKYAMARTGGNIFVHSIKNQLLAERVLIGRMQAELSGESPDPQKLSKDLQQLSETADTMMTHINDLYHSFREPKVRFTEVPLAAILENAETRLKVKHPEAQVEVVSGAHYLLTADGDVLAEAILNLMVNAWEATAAAGRTGEPIRIRTYVSQSCVVIEIADRGLGIPKSKRSRIFEPFYTDKNTNQNWGMGLYLTYSAVRSHYGNIEVESRVGVGSTFCVILPMYHIEGGTRA